MSANHEIPALSTLPDDGNLYGEVESAFNLSSMSKDYTLAKCKMCGAAISADDESREKHKQFHVDLLTVVDTLNDLLRR